MKDEMRNMIEHYKLKLRSGERGSLVGPRQTGRTQAILEYAHELAHEGKQVIVVCITHNAMRVAIDRYSELFPTEFTNQNNGPVRFLPNERERVERALCGGNPVVLWDLR